MMEPLIWPEKKKLDQKLTFVGAILENMLFPRVEDGDGHGPIPNCFIQTHHAPKRTCKTVMVSLTEFRRNAKKCWATMTLSSWRVTKAVRLFLRKSRHIPVPQQTPLLYENHKISGNSSGCHPEWRLMFSEELLDPRAHLGGKTLDNISKFPLLQPYEITWRNHLTFKITKFMFLCSDFGKHFVMEHNMMVKPTLPNEHIVMKHPPWS